MGLDVIDLGRRWAVINEFVPGHRSGVCLTPCRRGDIGQKDPIVESKHLERVSRSFLKGVVEGPPLGGVYQLVLVRDIDCHPPLSLLRWGRAYPVKDGRHKGFE